MGMAEMGSTEKLKVFISYSRRDSSDFAEELLAGLELAGFAPFLDRHDIAPGEPWEDRLTGLIQQADTIVYVISPEAVKSERCEWEVDKALALSKRLMPIVFKTVPEAEIPEQLRQRQFVRFDTVPGITRPLARLAEALRQDLDWVREHTRMGELAGRWEGRGHPESLLLRGEDLAAAQVWDKRRKPDAPAITETVRAFIRASREAEATYLAKSKATRRRVIWAQAFSLVFGLAVVGLGAGWLKQDWLKEHAYLWRNVNVLTAAEENGLKTGDPFHECTDCSEMVVIPAGHYLMGSPADQKMRQSNEGPQHEVVFAHAFAIAKFDVTFDNWDACSAHDACNWRILDEGKRGRHPVVNITWDDANRYIAWIRSFTGKRYRLPSEAEWEYAARAGTTTKYFFGADETLIDQFAWTNTPEGTHPVGEKKPNPFGLFDVYGNVSQWVEDCYNDNYKGAPTDGSAWITGDCHFRITRGSSYRAVTHSSSRRGHVPVTAVDPASLHGFNAMSGSGIGFRIARTLDTR
jgi:formylglycine-generating enzyme required for sulfatase activity